MLSEKIPRAEIQIVETILKRVAVSMNDKLLVMICGSYRRGRDKSGDIDCLIAHPDIKTKFDLDNIPINILSSFVEVLMNVNFIVDQIDMGMKKFMGFCKLIQKSSNQTPTQPNPAIARRLDIRFVPYESYGSAILYFTGSKKFNTNMRSHALQKGYSLNEFGLTKISDNTIIPCFTEETVFTILNYPYKKPEERDI
jgi:DNA polymerase beta